MGLISRAKDEQFAKLMKDSEEAKAREKRELASEERRIQIITQHLKTIAGDLRESFEQLTSTPVGLPRYYQIGDVIIMIQRFVGSDEKPNPADPRLVRFSYCAYLMAVHVGGKKKKLVYRKIGTLQLIDYQGIAQAITQAPPDYVFDANAVRAYLP